MKHCPKEECLQAYLDGELTAAANEAVRAHLSTCSPCTLAWQEMEQAFALMNCVFAAELPEAVPTARLQARVATALAQETAPKFAWTLPSFGRFGWLAAALLVAGIAGWAWLGTRSVQLPQQAHYEIPAPAVTSPAPLPSWQEHKPEIAQQSQRPRRRVPRHTRENQAAETEIVTPFFLLREGEELTALENMRLVRVELPSSSLGEVGLPVALVANASVKADVVLGDDGLARAIRFVR